MVAVTARMDDQETDNEWESNKAVENRRVDYTFIHSFASFAASSPGICLTFDNGPEASCKNSN